MTASNKCLTAGVYKSLEFCKGTTVLPGIRTRVYAIPKKDIVKFPTLPPIGGDDMSKLGTLEGEFTLASDKKWVFIDILDGESQFSCESQGEEPSKTFINKATIKHASQGEDVVGFCRQANTEDFVYLIQQRDGKYRLFGNEAFTTYTKPKMESGQGVSGKAGTTFEIEVTDLLPAPYYVGKIETAEGDVNVSEA